jgi:hypothetical protein
MISHEFLFLLLICLFVQFKNPPANVAGTEKILMQTFFEICLLIRAPGASLSVGVAGSLLGA